MSSTIQIYDISLLHHIFMQRAYPARVNTTVPAETMFISWLMHKLQTCYLLDYSISVYDYHGIPRAHPVLDFHDRWGEVSCIIESVFSKQLRYVMGLPDREVIHLKYNNRQNELTLFFNEGKPHELHTRYKRVGHRVARTSPTSVFRNSRGI